MKANKSFTKILGKNVKKILFKVGLKSKSKKTTS